MAVHVYVYCTVAVVDTGMVNELNMFSIYFEYRPKLLSRLIEECSGMFCTMKNSGILAAKR